MEVLRLSDEPVVTLRLGNPALFRWVDDAGYVELEVGAIAADERVVLNLAEFWDGRWCDWQYQYTNDQLFVSIELEREDDGQVWLRLDYHHMLTHLGIDWRMAVVRESEAEPHGVSC